MVEILSSKWAEQRLSYEVMTELAGAFSERCLSSIKPFISIRSTANNQLEVPVSLRKQELFLKMYRIYEQKPPSIAPHPSKCFVVLEQPGA